MLALEWETSADELLKISDMLTPFGIEVSSLDILLDGTFTRQQLLLLSWDFDLKEPFVDEISKSRLVFAAHVLSTIVSQVVVEER